MEQVQYAVRTAARLVASTVHRSRPVTAEDELLMAQEYDRARGFERSPEERSKTAHDLSGSAPQIKWTPRLIRQQHV